MICSFCLSVAARIIVRADQSLRYTSMLDFKQETDHNNNPNEEFIACRAALLVSIPSTHIILVDLVRRQFHKGWGEAGGWGWTLRTAYIQGE